MAILLDRPIPRIQNQNKYMNRLSQSILIIACAVILAGCSRNDAPFAVGQVWKYDCRKGEEGSRVIICKIEKLAKAGEVVHIKITDLNIKNPAAPGALTSIGHIPISPVTLRQSVTVLTRERADMENFGEGYRAWMLAYKNGKAGIFPLRVKDVIIAMEKAIAKNPSGSSKATTF